MFSLILYQQLCKIQRQNRIKYDKKLYLVFIIIRLKWSDTYDAAQSDPI
jgi:hypothetical protein